MSNSSKARRMIVPEVGTISMDCFQCFWNSMLSRVIEESGAKLKSCSAIIRVVKGKGMPQTPTVSPSVRQSFDTTQEHRPQNHLFRRIPIPSVQVLESRNSSQAAITSDSTTTKSVNSVAIAVGVCGGVSLVLALIAIYFFLTSRMKHKTGKCKCAEQGKQCRYERPVLPRGGDPFHHTRDISESSNSFYQGSSHPTFYSDSSSNQPFLSNGSLPHNTYYSRNDSPNGQPRIKRSFDHSNEPWNGFSGNPNISPDQPLLPPDQIYPRATDRPPSAFGRSFSDTPRPPVTRSSTFADLRTPSTPYGVLSPVGGSRPTTPSTVSQTSQAPYTPPHLRQHQQQRLPHAASRSFSAADLSRTSVELQNRQRANSVGWSQHDQNPSQQHNEQSGLMEVHGSEAVWQGERGMRGVVHEVEAEMVAVELDSRPSMLALKRMKKTFGRWM